MVHYLTPLFKVLPAHNAYGHHAEPKKEILQRNGTDAYAHEKLRIIHHDMAREIPIHQELKTDNHGKKSVVWFLSQDPDPALMVYYNGHQNCDNSKQSVFFQRILSLIWFIASQVKIQQNGITTKNKTSSTGRFMILNFHTPAGLKNQCPR